MVHVTLESQIEHMAVSHFNYCVLCFSRLEDFGTEIHINYWYHKCHIFAHFAVAIPLLDDEHLNFLFIQPDFSLCTQPKFVILVSHFGVAWYHMVSQMCPNMSKISELRS